MIKYSGRIVQFGFGAVGKSFYEKVRKEISFIESNYYVITADNTEFDAYINMDGLAPNFIVAEVTKENFQEIFSMYLQEGDLLIDFADTVGTKDICTYCCNNNIMYINTGEADWPENWYSIFTENELKKELKKKYANNKYPIILQHGNNPGLVSHFVKLAIEYIVNKQFKHNKYLKKLLQEQKWNLIAQAIGIKMIHVNDIDLQDINEKFNSEKLVNTWCVDSFFFEMLSESTQELGTHEVVENLKSYNKLDKEKGFLEYQSIARDFGCKTYYPNGSFEGLLTPHEEIITIANNLEVYENNSVIYRPSVMFIYKPCSLARDYLDNARVDSNSSDNKEVVRGHIYPKEWEIVYPEKIDNGTEYVGVLILGEKFDPVWVGNRVEISYLKKDKPNYWQTPTITPVAMSALAAVCLMLKNKNLRGINFPDDLTDYKYIIKLAEKYISKTIYKTFSQEEIANSLNIDFNTLTSEEFYANKKE